MNDNFEYIDIILLAMIAGFIFLRLRGILGRKTGHQQKPFNPIASQVKNKNIQNDKKIFEKKDNLELEEHVKEKFLQGANIAYEMIVTSFAKGDSKTLKPLLNKDVYNKFIAAIDERKLKNLKSETTFIGIKSTKIKEFSKKDNIYNITVSFISEIITCIKDKDDKIVEGNPDIIKIVNDDWKFSKNMWSQNPTWYLVDTSN